MGNEPVIKIDGNECTMTWYSLDSFANYVNESGKVPDYYKRPEVTPGEPVPEPDPWSGGWYEDVLTAALNGWEAEMPEALDIAESAVVQTERALPSTMFAPVWDVSGAEVDMGRYVTGEPENMIDFPLNPTVKQGKVVTVCASFGALGNVEAEAKIAQGRVVTALCMTLANLGYNTELWADYSGMKTSTRLNLRVMVKGPNDVIDPARILFAYAHPGAQRRLGFTAMGCAPRRWAGHGFGSQGTRAPHHDLPEGTIYLDQPRGEIPDAAERVRELLKEAGIIE